MTESIADVTNQDASGVETKSARKWIRRAIYGSFISFFGALVIANTLVFFNLVPNDSLLSKHLIEHYDAITGLPCAALMAFAVVWTYRTTDGPLELEAWGLKFKGAAGPIIMWVLVFVAIATALGQIY